MDFLIYYWSPAEFEHHVAQFFCFVLLTAILIDAKIVGLLSQAMRLVMVPFVVGVLLIEVAGLFPNPSDLLLWLCVTSTYYVSIRLNRKSGQDPKRPGTLTRSFMLMWTLYAVFTETVQALIAYSHQNYSTVRRPMIEVGTEKFVEWLTVMLMAWLIGFFFERNPRLIRRGVFVVAAGVLVLVGSYKFYGAGWWQGFWDALKVS